MPIYREGSQVRVKVTHGNTTGSCDLEDNSPLRSSSLLPEYMRKCVVVFKTVDTHRPRSDFYSAKVKEDASRSLSATCLEASLTRQCHCQVQVHLSPVPQVKHLLKKTHIKTSPISPDARLPMFTLVTIFDKMSMFSQMMACTLANHFPELRSFSVMLSDENLLNSLLSTSVFFLFQL